MKGLKNNCKSPQNKGFYMEIICLYRQQFKLIKWINYNLDSFLFIFNCVISKRSCQLWFDYFITFCGKKNFIRVITSWLSFINIYLTSFHFIITMTNHSSSNLDYTSDLRKFELFYIIEGLDIQESWKLSKEILWIEEIRNCIIYVWNLGALKGFVSKFMRLLIYSFLL